MTADCWTAADQELLDHDRRCLRCSEGEQVAGGLCIACEVADERDREWWAEA